MDAEDYVIIDDEEGYLMLRVRLGELETDADRLSELAEPEVCECLGEVARLEARLKLRLMELTTRTAAKLDNGDRLLSVGEAALKLGCTHDFLYRNSKSLPFTVRNGRQLRFSERGIERYIRQRMGS